jgi:hypothetical protein
MEPEVEKLMMEAFAKNFIDYEGISLFFHHIYATQH